MKKLILYFGSWTKRKKLSEVFTTTLKAQQSGLDRIADILSDGLSEGCPMIIRWSSDGRPMASDQTNSQIKERAKTAFFC